MAITNQERVGKAVDLLSAGLVPYVEREFTSAHKDKAAAAARWLLPMDGARSCNVHRRRGGGSAAVSG